MPKPADTPVELESDVDPIAELEAEAGRIRTELKRIKVRMRADPEPRTAGAKLGDLHRTRRLWIEANRLARWVHDATMQLGDEATGSPGRQAGNTGQDQRLNDLNSTVKALRSEARKLARKARRGLAEATSGGDGAPIDDLGRAPGGKPSGRPRSNGASKQKLRARRAQLTGPAVKAKEAESNAVEPKKAVEPKATSLPKATVKPKKATKPKKAVEPKATSLPKATVKPKKTTKPKTAKPPPGAAPVEREQQPVGSSAAGASTRRADVIATAVAVAAAGAGLLIGLVTGGGEPQPQPLRAASAPAPEDVQLVRSTLNGLATSRAAELARLRRADTAEAQASAGESLAVAHSAAAGSLAADSVPPAWRDANRSLVDSLRNLAAAYDRLSRAAAGANARIYERAEAQVRQAERGLERALATAESEGRSLQSSQGAGA